VSIRVWAGGDGSATHSLTHSLTHTATARAVGGHCHCWCQCMQGATVPVVQSPYTSERDA
jgi:hypothetical protein